MNCLPDSLRFTPVQIKNKTFIYQFQPFLALLCRYYWRRNHFVLFCFSLPYTYTNQYCYTFFKEFYCFQFFGSFIQCGLIIFTPPPNTSQIYSHFTIHPTLFLFCFDLSKPVNTTQIVLDVCPSIGEWLTYQGLYDQTKLSLPTQVPNN